MSRSLIIFKSLDTGSDAVDDCRDCDPGYYCDNMGISNVTGPCSPGYFCDGASSSPTPSGNGGDLCPKGHYCIKVSINIIGGQIIYTLK